MVGKLLNEKHLVSILKRRVHRLTCAYSCQNATLLEISCRKLKMWQAIVEVQFYGSYERMLLSPMRSNKLKWRNDIVKGENLIKIKTKVFSIVTIINVAYGIRTDNAELKSISAQYSCVLPATDSQLSILAVYT